MAGSVQPRVGNRGSGREDVLRVQTEGRDRREIALWAALVILCGVFASEIQSEHALLALAVVISVGLLLYVFRKLRH